MAVATDGNLEFVLVGVMHDGHNVLNGARPEDGYGHAMKHVALICCNRTARLLIQEQGAIELRHAIKRARCVACLSDPGTRIGIKTHNRNADAELRELPT